MPGNPFRTRDRAQVDTDIDQPDEVDLARIRRRAGPPKIHDLAKFTRTDTELFFEASHAFRTRLATALPDIAEKLVSHMLGVPYTMLDSKGNPVQLLPDSVALTPTQAKLAGMVLNRLLPPLADTGLDGAPGTNNAKTIIDARKVKISVGVIAGPAPAEDTVAGGDPVKPVRHQGDPTDARLRDGGEHGAVREYRHPHAAQRVAPVTVTLHDMVERAKELHRETDEPTPGYAKDGNPDDIPDADPPAPAPVPTPDGGRQ